MEFNVISHIFNHMMQLSTSYFVFPLVNWLLYVNLTDCYFFQFCKTVVSQGHLCPLPLHVCPVYWAYDNGLQLYPLPDLVVCADKYDPFHSKSVDCTVLNPVSLLLTLSML